MMKGMRERSFQTPGLSFLYARLASDGVDWERIMSDRLSRKAVVNLHIQRAQSDVSMQANVK